VSGTTNRYEWSLSLFGFNVRLAEVRVFSRFLVGPERPGLFLSVCPTLGMPLVIVSLAFVSDGKASVANVDDHLYRYNL
jgi:hypothetical protein